MGEYIENLDPKSGSQKNLDCNLDSLKKELWNEISLKKGKKHNKSNYGRHPMNLHVPSVLLRNVFFLHLAL